MKTQKIVTVVKDKDSYPYIRKGETYPVIRMSNIDGRHYVCYSNGHEKYIPEEYVILNNQLELF